MNELWRTWFGDEQPAEVLRRADRAVGLGQFVTRREAFVDFMLHALRILRPDTEGLNPDRLAARLLEYAESCEIVGP